MEESGGLPVVETVGRVAFYPPAVALTGTVTSAALIVTGVGTLFRSELSGKANPIGEENTKPLKYGYIVNPANGEIREITAILSDTKLKIKTAFGTNLAGATASFISASIRYVSVSISNLGAGVKFCAVNQVPVTLDADTIVNNEKTGARIFPLGIDGTAGGCQVAVVK